MTSCFDELGHFSKSQYQYLSLWVRSTTPGQRCRVLSAGNPPRRLEGLWVVQHWAPWHDKTHPDPAAPGELRWPVPIEEDSERELFFRSKEEAVAHLANFGTPPRNALTGEIEPPRSRTFVPGILTENLDLAETNRGAALQSGRCQSRWETQDRRVHLSARCHTCEADHVSGRGRASLSSLTANRQQQ